MNYILFFILTLQFTLNGFDCYIHKSTITTTKNIARIIVSRCKEINTGDKSKCDEFLNLFKQGLGQVNCNGGHNYSSVIQFANPVTKENDLLLWSGFGSRFKQDVRSKYGRFSTINDLLLGYALDDLSWCSNKEKPGEFAPNCKNCDLYYKSAQGVYWDQISKRLASLAKGSVVHVLLNGEKSTIFNSGGVFGRVEVNEIRKLPLKLKILILNSKDHACLNDSSVQQLKSIMNGKIDDCVDKQPEVVQIMKCQSGSSCYLYKSNSISTITSDVTLIISLYVIKLIFQ